MAMCLETRVQVTESLRVTGVLEETNACGNRGVYIAEPVWPQHEPLV